MALEEHKRKDLHKKIKQFLKNSDSYTKLAIASLTLKENIKKHTSSITCDLILKEEKIKIKGEGNGLVDALLPTIIYELSHRYNSLKNIRLSEFYATAKIKKKSKLGTDSPVKVELVLLNSEGKKLYFSAHAKSMNTATILVIVEAVEYFINSEIAILELKKCVDDAKKRNRGARSGCGRFALIGQPSGALALSKEVVQRGPQASKPYPS